MTQKELHNQRLVKEAEEAACRMNTRRHFLKECAFGFGSLALGSLLQSCGLGTASTTSNPLFDPAHPLAPKMPQFAPKAKSVIYLHMAGAPSQLELFDYKPTLQKYTGKPCPDEYLKGKRFAFIKGVPNMLGTPFKFSRHGQSGMELSELIPHLGTVA